MRIRFRERIIIAQYINPPKHDGDTIWLTSQLIRQGMMLCDFGEFKAPPTPFCHSFMPYLVVILDCDITGLVYTSKKNGWKLRVIITHTVCSIITYPWSNLGQTWISSNVLGTPVQASPWWSALFPRAAEWQPSFHVWCHSSSQVLSCLDSCSCRNRLHP